MTQVNTLNASNVVSYQAQLNSELTDLGGATNADVWFQYREQGASTWSETPKDTLSSTGTYGYTVELTANTGYEFRAKADNGSTVDTGDIVQFSTSSFSEAWTPRWAASASDFSLIEDSSSEYGGSVIEFSKNDGTRSALEYSDYPAKTDVDTLALGRITESSDVYEDWLRVIVRGSSPNGNEQGYYCTVDADSNSSTGYYLLMKKYVDGAISTIGSAEIPDPIATGYKWIRLRASGDTIEAKFWDLRTAEPDGYDISVVDTSISGSGWAGVGSFTGDRQQWDYFAVSTEGEVQKPTPELKALAEGSTNISPEVVSSPTVSSSGEFNGNVRPSLSGESNIGGLGARNIGEFAVGGNTPVSATTESVGDATATISPVVASVAEPESLSDGSVSTSPTIVSQISPTVVSSGTVDTSPVVATLNSTSSQASATVSTTSIVANIASPTASGLASASSTAQITSSITVEGSATGTVNTTPAIASIATVDSSSVATLSTSPVVASIQNINVTGTGNTSITPTIVILASTSSSGVGTLVAEPVVIVHSAIVEGNATATSSISSIVSQIATVGADATGTVGVDPTIVISPSVDSQSDGVAEVLIDINRIRDAEAAGVGSVTTEPSLIASPSITAEGSGDIDTNIIIRVPATINSTGIATATTQSRVVNIATVEATASSLAVVDPVLAVFRSITSTGYGNADATPITANLFSPTSTSTGSATVSDTLTVETATVRANSAGDVVSSPSVIASPAPTSTGALTVDVDASQRLSAIVKADSIGEAEVFFPPDYDGLYDLKLRTNETRDFTISDTE